MIEIKHWLYGICKFNVLVKNETKCSQCLHVGVCGRKLTTLCANYEFGSSAEGFRGCQSCIHRFTRYDKNSIPCFRCFHFRRRKR